MNAWGKEDLVTSRRTRNDHARTGMVLLSATQLQLIHYSISCVIKKIWIKVTWGVATAAVIHSKVYMLLRLSKSVFIFNKCWERALRKIGIMALCCFSSPSNEYINIKNLELFHINLPASANKFWTRDYNNTRTECTRYCGNPRSHAYLKHIKNMYIHINLIQKY